MHFLNDDLIYLEKNFIQAYLALCQVETHDAKHTLLCRIVLTRPHWRDFEHEQSV